MKKLVIAGSVAGAIAGYLYYHFIGCVGGGCPITSQPVNSSLYGALFGGLLLSIFGERAGRHDGKRKRSE